MGVGGLVCALSTFKANADLLAWMRPQQHTWAAELCVALLFASPGTSWKACMLQREPAEVAPMVAAAHNVSPLQAQPK